MKRRVWPETVVGAVITAGMVSCVVLAGVSLGHMIVPDWDGTYLLVFCALTAVEAFVSYRLYRQFHFYVTGGTRFRVIELVLLLIAFLLISNIVEGYPILERGALNLRLPALLLFIGVLLCWQVAGNTASDLDTIRREEETVRMPAAGAGSSVVVETVRDSMQNVSPAARGLVYRFFIGGVFLFILAGLTQTQNAQLLNVTRPDLAGPLVNVLVYFGLGMVMLGLLRFSTLSIEWALAGNILSPTLAARWVRYSAIFLAGLAVFAFLLPTSYGTELLGAARDVLAHVLSSLGSSVASFMSHMGLAPQGQPHAPPPRVHPPPGFHPPGIAKPVKQHPLNFDWLFIVRAILFWAALLALVAYLARNYLAAQRNRRAPTGPSLLRRLGIWLERIWTALRVRARRYVEVAMDLIPHREPSAERALPSLPARLRLSHLPARERIVYYFLSIVQRLEREGHRRPSQTALELDEQIGPLLGEAQGDMHHLTQAYLEARYSAHPLGAEDAEGAKGSWQRVRAALRRKNKATESEVV